MYSVDVFLLLRQVRPCAFRFEQYSAAVFYVDDAEGNTYVIYDVCYNRTVVESAMSVKSLKVFLVDMALTWLGQKYKTQLSTGNDLY